MPARSKRQQKSAGMAYAAKKGDISSTRLKGAARQMYESMSTEQLHDYAATKRSKLPEKKRRAK